MPPGVLPPLTVPSKDSLIVPASTTPSAFVLAVCLFIKDIEQPKIIETAAAIVNNKFFFFIKRVPLKNLYN